MTGRKTLREVRAELEAALGAGPAGDTEMAQSLRRFLAMGRKRKGMPKQPLHPTGGASPVADGSQPRRPAGR